MNSGNRKPIIVVAICAVIAALVLVLGVSCSGSNNAGAPGWQSGFAKAAGGGKLTTADLAPAGGSCSASGGQLAVAGSCTFEVGKFGGLFDFGPPTKRARLLPQQAVTVTLSVEGTRTEQSASAGDTVDLTFGTSGGSLGIRCLVPGNCVLQLAEAG
ncbi:hypothetical protein [Arthrobacter silvisoli]|uniref:hypothetical protein n=1 Tax=Arthrobacter silvisoli TaxID=2291022 RepID=UPI000E213BCB|nr:hypothetical protein [Arthrobacter silvisoli]